VGEHCVLAIRPENVALDSRPTPDGNLVRGRVAFISYLGSTVRYDVAAAGGQIVRADIRDAWHHEPLPVGREVTLSFPASVTLALADDV
jgi:hypothetical protein